MLTLVTAWYNFKSKFNVEVYRKWISNLLINVKKFKLIVYTNDESKWLIEPFIQNNENIKLVVLEIENFYGYKFKEQWIKNHTQNHELNNRVDWRVNMLWCEKVHFVKKAIDNNYFQEDSNKTIWFGWCDIGYFRGGPNNINVNKISEWPNKNKIDALDKNRIYYAQVSNNDYLNMLARIILNKNDKGLPISPIPADQTSVAGGFFLIAKDKINWWNKTYYERLKLYFDNNYLIKDDQIIIIDSIINNLSQFKLIKETLPIYDKWFAFSNYLL